MDLPQLKMFLAIAQRGSLVGAARDLKITPSAVSHALKNLETDVGCRLLERVGKRVFLNQAGEQLLAQISKPLAALARAEEDIRRLGKWGQTRLRIGSSASALQYILPPVIKRLKEIHPTVLVLVESGDIPEMVDLVRQNRVDLVVGVNPNNKSDLQIRPLFKDEMMFAFFPSHPWASARVIPTPEIPAQPFILYQKTSVTYQMIDDYFRRERMVPHTVMEIASIEAIKELVKLDLGVSILAPWTAERELREGTIKMRALGSRPLTRQWVIAHLAAHRLNLVEEAFCRLCKEHVAKLSLNRRDLE
jgi:LysR family transcriptional regulator, low CO2-responsive transcriptional regulator